MSPRKPTGRPAGRPRGPRRVVLLIRFTPGQARAIRAEAKRRQRASRAPQLDLSAVVRELVDRALGAGAALAS